MKNYLNVTSTRLFMTEIYRPKADYLNIGQISGVNLLEMQALVWRCVCGETFCMCVGRGGGGGGWRMKGGGIKIVSRARFVRK